jgi:transposase
VSSPSEWTEWTWQSPRYQAAPLPTARADGKLKLDKVLPSKSRRANARAGQPVPSPAEHHLSRDVRPSSHSETSSYTPPHGVRHLFAAYDLAKDQLYGHIKKGKNRSKVLEFCRYLRSLHPVDVRIAIVCDNYSPHPTTKRRQRVGTWAAAHNVEIAYTPAHSSWLDRIEAQFTALRYFTSTAPTMPATRSRVA